MRDYRQESDSLGSIEVPAEAYWGAQTQRSLQNFDFPASEQMPLPIIYALAHIKAAAANIHRRHGLDNSIANAIIAAADEHFTPVMGRLVPALMDRFAGTAKGDIRHFLATREKKEEHLV